MGDDYQYRDEYKPREQMDAEQARVERIDAYCTPFHATRNPKGNPHHVTVSVAPKTAMEPVESYERRVAVAVTLAMNPDAAKLPRTRPETNAGTDLPPGMSDVAYRWARALKDGTHWLCRAK